MPTSYRIRRSRSKQGLNRFPTFSLFFISLFFIFIYRNLKGVDPNPIKVRFFQNYWKNRRRFFRVYRVWRKWYFTLETRNCAYRHFCSSPRPYIPYVDHPAFRLQSTCYPSSNAAGNLPFSRREPRFAAAWEGRRELFTSQRRCGPHLGVFGAYRIAGPGIG
jgi:hypothetical protein